jgi:uncharacterized protein
MQFQEDSNGGHYHIKQYVAGKHIVINDTQYEHSLLLSPQQLTPWIPQTLDDLDKSHFDLLQDSGANIILLGVGARLVFPDFRFFAHLKQHNIGVEVMDTHAACRTYTVLAAEGRTVLAALLI